MNKIIVTGIELYGHHGCTEAERNLGGKYSVDIEITTDFSKSIKSDDLNDTVDYVRVREIAEEEMAVSSNLIEHVAGRTVAQLRKSFPAIKSVRVTVHKLSSPIGGFVRDVAVVVEG